MKARRGGGKKMEYMPTESGFEKPHIPEGLHHAVYIGDSDAPDGQYGPRVALDFLVYYDPERAPVKIGRIFGRKLTPKSKLWEAFTALGARLEMGKPFDAKALIGKPCRVMVEDYTDDNDGRTVSGIQKVKEPDKNTETFIVGIKEHLESGNTKRGTHGRSPITLETIEDLN